jgi:hypothetical protein
MNKKRKGIELRKLYSLGEDVTARADLGGGAVQVARVIATWSQGRRRQAGGGGGQTGGGGCLSQSPPG